MFFSSSSLWVLCLPLRLDTMDPYHQAYYSPAHHIIQSASALKCFLAKTIYSYFGIRCIPLLSLLAKGEV